MKKIFLLALIALAVASYQQKMPTISPSEANLYVGDILRLEVTGVNTPQWIIGCDKEYQVDSLKFAKIEVDKSVLALRPGKLTVGFQYFEALPLPTIHPAASVMHVGDTLVLLSALHLLPS